MMIKSILKKKTILVLLISIFTTQFTACFSDSESSKTNPCSKPASEKFVDNEKPHFEKLNYNGMTYEFLKPWNYDKSQNYCRKYPLIIYLHGNGNVYLPENIGGLSPGGSKDHPLETAFKKDNPSFVIFPHVWYGHFDKIIPLMEQLKKNGYRFDEKRIYLIGYSYGASGILEIAIKYSQAPYNQKIAGIVRMAGTNSLTVDKIKENFSQTNFWLHVGDTDDAKIVNATNTIYENLRIFHQFPKESQTSKTINVHVPRPWDVDLNVNTVVTSYSKNSREIIKRSTYGNNVGHGICPLALYDNEILKWLFEQKLP